MRQSAQPGVTIPTRRLAIAAVIVVAILLFCSLATPIALRVLGRSVEELPLPLQLLNYLFAIDEEANIPTWFATMALFLVALLLALIAACRKGVPGGLAWRWAGLSFVFLFLSVDEAAGVHEKVGRLIRLVYDPRMLYTWTIPGAIAVLVFGLAYLGFLRALPSPTRWLLCTSAALYVGGALGLEIIAGLVSHRLGDAYDASLEKVALTHSEELLELTGVLLTLYALARYIEDHIGPVKLRFGSAAPHETPPDR